ncbi:hypothetical protein HDV01_000913 [Terramyces sp. JEL0728]|nr:hypothetical protein HDV01_000913 [Terramyces sp. JEL0728]
MKRKYNRILYSLFLFMIGGLLFYFNESSSSYIELSDQEYQAVQYRPIEDVDFEALGKGLKTFAKYHNLIYERSRGWYKLFYHYEYESKIIDRQLFPWIHTSTVKMRKSFKGNGIVMSVNNNYTEFALSTLTAIRTVHKCNLPFEIFYIGENDLSKENQQKFKQIPNTKTIDLTKVFKNDILQLDGWDSKPFALLASSFRNAMIIDADTVFLQSPKLLFKDPQFLDKRALFFQDRKVYMLSYDGKLWLEKFFQDNLSEAARNYDILNWKSLHQQESGVVLIDKEMHLPGLLAACTLNMGIVKEITYEHVHGDKETFWIGFEVVGDEYAFNSIGAGVLGLLEHEDVIEDETFMNRYQVCNAQILHVTPTSGPVWMNGGIVQDKYNSSNHNILAATHYVNEPGEWRFSSTVKNRACLLTQDIPQPLSDELLGNIQQSGRVWKKLIK